MSGAVASTLPPGEGTATLASHRARGAAWAYRAAVLGIFAAFNLVTFNRYFPLSEGWWETYGYLWNSGLRPYRDFDLAFTPLFTILNAGLLRLLDDSFFAIRLLGVGVFLAAVLLLQLLVERFFAPWIAAVAVTVSTSFVVAATQFIAKDYHSYQLAFVALALLLHVRLAADRRLRPARRVAETLLLGLTVSLVFFLKQNVGAILLAAIAASLPLVDRERPLARLAAFGAGAAVPFLLMLPVISPPEWRQLLLANDAKGSLGTVLGRFWQFENREAIITALVLCAAVAAARWVFAPPARWQGVWTPSFEATLRNRTARGAAFLALVVAVAASGHEIRAFVVAWTIPVTLAFIALVLVRAGRALLDQTAAEPRWTAIAIPLLGLAYANTTTAAFDFIALHVPVALALGWLLATAEAWAPRRYALLAALALLVVVPELIAAKLRVPYAWWGHWQGSVSAATAESEYPQLRGIRMTPEQREVVDGVKAAVATYSRSRSDVLFFTLPVFYWLEGKLPPGRTVVQWFDVVSSGQMAAELEAIRERPPRLVVALEPPPAAYVVHRRLKNSARLPQEDFRALMDGWVASRKYRLVRSIALPSGNRGGYEVAQEVVVQRDQADGADPDALLAGTGVTVAASSPDETDEPARPLHGEPLQLGARVTVRGEYRRVRAAAELLGVARGRPRDWNTLNVYVREDGAASGGPSTPAP
ncbi:MAG TPA: hypothetical protein VFL83_19110 [Anaeromyxobacter sp.]|nr:hypothetical protein [Anaeromyxobacter sp.]